MFKKILHKVLPKGKFARGVAVLAGGTAGAQLLMILAAPLLTRLYTPEDFGLLAVYSSLLSLFTVISSMRYQLAIPLPESDIEAAHVTLLSFFIVIFVTVASGIVVITAGSHIAHLLGTPKLAEFFWLLPLGVFLIGSYQVFNYWALRTKSFPTIAKTKISQTLATVTIQVAGFKFGGIALILGQASGQGAGTLTLARPAIKRPEFKSWQWSDLKVVAKKYRRFPLFSTWGGFANTASVQLPPLMFAALFSPAIAGFYALSHRVITLPSGLISNAIGNVFYSNAAEEYRKDQLQPLFESVLDKLVMLSIPMMIMLTFAAPVLFELVFGIEWKQAGVFAQWMSIWIGMTFVASPLSVLFTVLEKEIAGLLFQASMLVIRVIVIGIGYKLDDVLLTVIMFSFSSALMWFGFLLWAANKSSSSTFFVISTFIKRTGLSLLLMLPLIFSSILRVEAWIWWSSLVISIAFLSAYILKHIKKAY